MAAEINRIPELLAEVLIRLDTIEAVLQLQQDTLTEHRLPTTNMSVAQERMSLILEKMLDRLDSLDHRMTNLEKNLNGQ